MESAVSARRLPRGEGKVTARKYDSQKLIQAAAIGEVPHALVAAVSQIVRLAGGVQEAKNAIDAVAVAYAAEEKDERQ